MDSPFLILHSSFSILHSLFFILYTPTFFCSSNDGGENGDELIGLVEQLGQTRLGNEFGGCYKTKPVVGFTGFFAGNEELVDKVCYGSVPPGLLPRSRLSTCPSAVADWLTSG